MSKTILVIRQELTNIFTRPAYLMFAFFIPAVAILIVAGVKIIQSHAGHNSVPSASGAGSSSQSVYDLAIEGFVDHSGLIQSLPENIPIDRIIAFADETQAKKALDANDITAYYVIPTDHLISGIIYYVYPDTKSYLADGQAWIIHWIITLNLLNNDQELADWLWNPIWDVQETNLNVQIASEARPVEDCTRPNGSCTSNDLVRYMPSIMVFFLYMTLMISSSRLFNSIGSEKDNRTLEVLLLSIQPHKLLAGKIIALGLAGIIQTTCWLGAILIIFNLGGRTLSLPENFTFPVDILVYGLLLFLGGYGLYAAMLSGVGALIPNLKESGGAFYIILLPLMIGYLIGLFAPLMHVTQTDLLITLSIIPFTAPVVMVMRLTDSIVPIWQILLAISLLYLTAVVTLRAATAMFHAQNLLSGQPFSLGRYLRVFYKRL